jgi:hypothetical protein
VAGVANCAAVSAVAGPALVTIAAVLTYRGMPPISTLAAWVWDWSSAPQAALLAGGIRAIDHRRRFGRDVVGMYEYQGQLVGVITVDGPAAYLTCSRSSAPMHNLIDSPLSAKSPLKMASRALAQTSEFQVYCTGVGLDCRAG